MPASSRLKSKDRSPEPGIFHVIRRFASRSYAPDWFGILLLALQNLAILFFEPFHRLFSLDDRRLQYPHADPERVPVPLLFLYALGLPCITITLYILFAPSGASKTHKLHVALLGLGTSLLFASFVTDLVKNTVGRPRPDLIARCKPVKGTPLHELVDWHVCAQQDHHTLHDGFRSFPSGHSSFSWAGLGYLTLFIAGQIHAFRPRSGLFKVVIALLPALAALLITISRTEDYRHDVFDVATGSCIGVCSAFFAYRRYFPGVTQKRCDVSFDRDGEGDDDDNEKGPQFERIPDLEMQSVDTERTGRV